jgi:hypothetical protein
VADLSQPEGRPPPRIATSAASAPAAADLAGPSRAAAASLGEPSRRSVCPTPAHSPATRTSQCDEIHPDREGSSRLCTVRVSPARHRQAERRLSDTAVAGRETGICLRPTGSLGNYDRAKSTFAEQMPGETFSTGDEQRAD